MESCSNVLETYPVNVLQSFHDFPQDHELSLLWKEACKIPHNQNTENLKVCSDHFDSNDYEIIFYSNAKNIRRLKVNAIPHCYLNIVKFEEDMEQSLNENELLKSQLELLENEKNELQNKIKQINAKTTRKLAAVQSLKIRCAGITRKYNLSQRKNLLTKVFSNTQIGVLMRKKKVVWTDDDLAMAFTLRHIGGKDCYLYLKQTLNFPLPALSCVQKWATSLHDT